MNIINFAGLLQWVERVCKHISVSRINKNTYKKIYLYYIFEPSFIFELFDFRLD